MTRPAETKYGSLIRDLTTTTTYPSTIIIPQERLAISRSCEDVLGQIAFDPTLPLEAKRRAYWETISVTSQHAELGIMTLAQQAIHGTDAQSCAIANTLLSDLLKREVYGYATSSSTHPYFAARLAATLTSFYIVQADTVSMPREAEKLLETITWKRKSREERMSILMAVSSATSDRLALLDSLPRRQTNPCFAEAYARRATLELLNVGTQLTNAAMSGQLTAEHLRLALLALGVDHEIITGNKKPSDIVGLARGAGGLFFRTFADRYLRPETYREGITIILNALTDKHASLDAKIKIITFLGNSYMHTANGRVQNYTLEPLVKMSINGILSDHSQEDEQLLRDLVEVTTFDTLDGPFSQKTNMMIQEIVRQKGLPLAYQVLLGRYFVESFNLYSMTALSDNEIYDLMTGKLTLLLEMNSPDGGVFLFEPQQDRSEWRLIGYIRERTIVPASNNTAAENVVNDTHGIAVAETLARDESEDASGTGETPLDGDTTKDATEETRREEIFKKVFGTPELTQEDIAELEAKRQNLWGELNPYDTNWKRRSTISRTGNQLQLHPTRRAVASDDHFPRVVIARREEKDEDGVFSSDIGGAIVLSPDLVYPFFLDRDGGLQGALADEFLEERLSYERYVQLNHTVVTLAHRIAVGIKIDYAQLEQEAHKRVKRETEDGTPRIGGRAASQERIAQLVANSQRYIKTRERRDEKTGHLITETYFDLDLIEDDLQPGESDTKYRWLTNDETEAQRKKARKGRAIPNADEGRAVALRPGAKPQRTAIENATNNHVRLWAAVFVSKDMVGAVTHIPKESTFARFPIPKEDTEPSAGKLAYQIFPGQNPAAFYAIEEKTIPKQHS